MRHNLCEKAGSQDSKCRLIKFVLYLLKFGLFPMHQNQTDLRPVVSAKDLAMILSAIGAYSHNAEFRDLRDRLQHQAVTWGVFRAG